MADSPALSIDVFADVVCPWCWIGERRLARALAERPHVRAERRWRPYQLDPRIPAGGLAWADVVRERFGGPERMRAMNDHVAAAGADTDADFHFDRVTRWPNTVDAHRVILLAAAEGRQWETVERLFRAHFAEGRDVGDRAELARLAAEAGLDADAVSAHLATDAGVAEVQQSQRDAARLGAQGVPFVVLGGRWAISGAQPLDVFLRALDTAVPAR